jgi:hypothetical protein
MANLVIDLVLLSCTFAFVTGIVIAAANLTPLYPQGRPHACTPD